MPTTLKTLVNTAILSGDKVFVHASPMAIRDGLSLLHGGERLVLSPVANPSRDLPGQVYRKDLLPDAADIALEAHTPNGARLPSEAPAPINALQDWALTGGRTAQIRIDTHAAPHIVSLSKSLTVSGAQGALRFRALLAAHRCAARLLIHLAPTDGSTASSHIVAFDASKLGGTSEGGYQDVDIPLVEAGAAETRLSVHLYFDGGTENVEGHAPYLFLANPRLEGAGGDGAATAPVTTLVGQTHSANWYAARVKPNGTGPLELRLGDDSAPLAGSPVTS